MRIHAHHIVFPEPHGKWSKVARFVTWLRREVARTTSTARAKRRER